jgi:uncharacterized protein (DUF488 family)
MSAFTLYTIGYEKRSLGEYVQILSAAGIRVVVDVRETAWSHKPGFSKSSFRAALAEAGIEYHHARFAGNPKALRRTARSHAECLRRFGDHLEETPAIRAGLEALIQEYLKAGKRVALTCFERHPEDCHRGILAAAWARGRRRRVEHLEPDGCARLIRT